MIVSVESEEDAEDQRRRSSYFVDLALYSGRQMTGRFMSFGVRTNECLDLESTEPFLSHPRFWDVCILLDTGDLL